MLSTVQCYAYGLYRQSCTDTSLVCLGMQHRRHLVIFCWGDREADLAIVVLGCMLGVEQPPLNGMMMKDLQLLTAPWVMKVLWILQEQTCASATLQNVGEPWLNVCCQGRQP